MRLQKILQLPGVKLSKRFNCAKSDRIISHLTLLLLVNVSIILLLHVYPTTRCTSTINMAFNSTMASTLPQVSFGFDDLKDRMGRFTVNFDEFIDKGRKRIADERNEFAKNVVEDKGFLYSSPEVSHADSFRA